MTRVTHILGNLEYRGLQRRVLTLIRELPQYAHTVIFSSVDRGPLHPEYSASSQVIHCPFPRGGITSALPHLLRLANALREAAPDVVLAHLFGNHVLVSAAGVLAGSPVTYGVSANNPVHYSRSRWKPLLLAQLGRPLCRGEIAVSESVGAVLRDSLWLPARRVHVVPNGCAVERIAARAEVGRAAPRAAGARHRLLMAAWQGRAKDHQTAIEAVAVLRRKGVPVDLQLAGGAQHRERLAAMEALAKGLGVTDSVRFLGVRNDVPELMGASDVVIHATHSEGLPGVLLEAFASRTPVVASDIPPCREVLDGGRCGILVLPGDSVALASAVESLLTGDDLRHRFAAAAFERVRDRYNAGGMAAGYAALIEDAIRN